jgi:hypothetical protein
VQHVNLDAQRRSAGREPLRPASRARGSAQQLHRAVEDNVQHANLGMHSRSAGREPPRQRAAPELQHHDCSGPLNTTCCTPSSTHIGALPTASPFVQPAAPGPQHFDYTKARNPTQVAVVRFRFTDRQRPGRYNSVKQAISGETTTRTPTQQTQCADTSRRAPAQPHRRAQVCLHGPRRRACDYNVTHTAFSGHPSLHFQRTTHRKTDGTRTNIES